jgi:alpha-L-rhamnosidase
MISFLRAIWIKPKSYNGDNATDFYKSVEIEKKVKKAWLHITAHGVFEAFINSQRVSEDVLMPGWTAYVKRLRYISYDVTDMLKVGKNQLKIGVGKGWFFHNIDAWGTDKLKHDEAALMCSLEVVYEDGDTDEFPTDSSWKTAPSNIVFNNIYDGETVDLRIKKTPKTKAVEVAYTRKQLIPFEGVPIREQERFSGAQLIVTPKGEKVIDFGQEVTGYVEFSAKAPKNRKIIIKHFEVLDKDGNVYTENLRSAKATYTVISDGKPFTVKPSYTFYGFRYIQVIGLDDIKPEDFTAIVVHSEMKRTGYFSCSNELLTKFAQNVVWGQKGNFLDVPTDCPQRDERLGWTGDAAVFCRTAAINFDVKDFFDKWLNDLEADQLADGSLPHVCPYINVYWRGADGYNSPVWEDVAVIAPWEMYVAYGDKEILRRHYNLMKKWVDYMINEGIRNGGGEMKHPWTTGGYGDWLSLEDLDKEEASGETDNGLISTAFLANGIKTLMRVNRILGYKDDRDYEGILKGTVDFFRSEYMKNGKMKQETQTAAVLAIIFGLTDKPEVTKAQLAKNVKKHGRITTGFTGTTYLLDALSEAGEDKLAVDLLLRTEYPSWLYPVTKGATTVWERWNGIFPDGRFANAGMNSFNHYAYGCVLAWMYRHLAGIRPDEENAGYKKIIFAPAPDRRIPWVKASLDTVCGEAVSYYKKTKGGWDFEFTVPKGSKATAVIFGKEYQLKKGLNKISVKQK